PVACASRPSWTVDWGRAADCATRVASGGGTGEPATCAPCWRYCTNTSGSNTTFPAAVARNSVHVSWPENCPKIPGRVVARASPTSRTRLDTTHEWPREETSNGSEAGVYTERRRRMRRSRGRDRYLARGP